MTKLFLIARKIHRLLVLIITALMLVMAGTGVVMRYPAFFLEKFPKLNAGQLRFVHNKISTYFSVILALMVITGLYMYLHQWWARRKARTQPTVQP